MADRVSASIRIGGCLDRTTFDALCDLIAQARLAPDWDGALFDPSDRIDGEPLALHAHDVAAGRFADLETFCVAQGLPFIRWSGACPGVFVAERVVFSGAGDPTSTATDDEERVLIARDTVEALGSFAAVLACFDAAAFAVPPLVVSD